MSGAPRLPPVVLGVADDEYFSSSASLSLNTTSFIPVQERVAIEKVKYDFHHYPPPREGPAMAEWSDALNPVLRGIPLVETATM